MLQTLKKNQNSKSFFYGINSGNYGFLMNKFSNKYIVKNLSKAKTVNISPIQRKRKIEDINIGETVYAIGNPQGLGQSVSMGIISAIGRKFINKEGSFIQTDASINPGNSGGALVDSNGNLLGVINFIESTTGGNQGLNFAIPIDVVSESYSKILKETKR